ncbi:hypothetical protein [Botrimarina sp.]|uniref:hypothetical protein n=1 Tax=Botrimarina sp. TaxID=2795802 RepID=UPI0032EAB803
MPYQIEWSLEKLSNGEWLVDTNPLPLPWEKVLADLALEHRVTEESASLHLYNLATLQHYPPDASGRQVDGNTPTQGWISVAAILKSDWIHLPFAPEFSSDPYLAIEEWLRRLAVLTPLEHFRYAFKMQHAYDINEGELFRRLGGLRESAKQSNVWRSG